MLPKITKATLIVVRMPPAIIGGGDTNDTC